MAMFNSQKVTGSNGKEYNGWKCSKCGVTGLSNDRHAHRYGKCWKQVPTQEDRRKTCPSCLRPRVSWSFGGKKFPHICNN